MQEKKLDNSEMSRILLVEKVGPFNTTWLFYKPRKITIYYDDRTVHIAAPANKGNFVNDHSPLLEIPIYKVPFSENLKSNQVWLV